MVIIDAGDFDAELIRNLYRQLGEAIGKQWKHGSVANRQFGKQLIQGNVAIFSTSIPRIMSIAILRTFQSR